MRRIVLLLLLVGSALAVLGVVEWKFVLAPLLGLTVAAWGLATMRSFQGGAHGADMPVNTPVPVAPEDRTLYWCEECGTELLLVVKGSGTAPRHCGTKMHARTEIARS